MATICTNPEHANCPGDRVHCDASPTKVLLCIPPQTAPIYLLVEGLSFRKRDHVSDDDEPHERYFYDEHTCPTNWIRYVVEIMIGGDSDPHGLARFVAVEDGHPEKSPDGIAEGDIRRMVKRYVPQRC